MLDTELKNIKNFYVEIMEFNQFFLFLSISGINSFFSKKILLLMKMFLNVFAD